MKKIIFLLLVCGWLVSTASSEDEAGRMSEFFPDMEGWVKDDTLARYTSKTLFEYINGAAEVYLSYGFQELAVLNYDRTQDQSITIEIYRQNSMNNGFGIYSQEKPLKSTFLTIGAQGYYEPGMLNFYKGPYYVKILSFSLGNEDFPLLRLVAGKIAERIPDEAVLPKPLHCFPKRGKVNHSERYIAKNFIGHSFLYSAFVADYLLEKEKTRLFIIEAAREDEAKVMLEAYLDLLEKKNITYQRKGDVYRFRDPYFDEAKTMHLKQKGKYIWGMFASDPSVTDSYLMEVENYLKGFNMLD